jgi:hypothetical protein
VRNKHVEKVGSRTKGRQSVMTCPTQREAHRTITGITFSIVLWDVRFIPSASSSLMDALMYVKAIILAFSISHHPQEVEYMHASHTVRQSQSLSYSIMRLTHKRLQRR